MKSVLLAVVGPSASGKSWLAERLVAALAPNALCISQDWFYKDQSALPPEGRALVNYDHPRSLDWVSLSRALRHLKAGRPARVPQYDFATHTRRGEWDSLKPRRFVIVEGLWLLHRRELRSLFDWSVFLKCSSRLSLQRRVERDVRLRGRTRKSVIHQFRTMVEPMQKEFVGPQERFARLVISRAWGEPVVVRLAATLQALSGTA